MMMNYWIERDGDVWFVFQNGLRLTTEFKTEAEARQYIAECRAYDREHNWD